MIDTIVVDDLVVKGARASVARVWALCSKNILASAAEGVNSLRPSDAYMHQ